MTTLSETMNHIDIKNSIALTGIFASAVFSFWSLVISRRTAKKTLFINSVTAARVKWIDTVRQSIAEFCGLVIHIGLTDMDEKEERELIEKTDRLRYLIRLQLNRSAPIDQYIIKQVDDIAFLLDDTDADDLDTDQLEDMVEALVTSTQDLLKMEWEKVKAETVNGDLSQDQKRRLQSL